jgi:cobalamin biosynthesis Mg chelatase CobN
MNSTNCNNTNHIYHITNSVITVKGEGVIKTMKTEATVLIFVLVLALTLAGVVSAHPGHGTPIEVPSEPSNPDPGSPPPKSTSPPSASDSKTVTKTGTTTTPTGSGPAETEPGQTVATPTSSGTSNQSTENVSAYESGDPEDLNPSWPISVLFGVAAIIGAVGVHYRGERLGL